MPQLALYECPVSIPNAPLSTKVSIKNHVNKKDRSSKSTNENLYTPFVSIRPNRINHYSRPVQEYSRKRKPNNPYRDKGDRSKEIENRKRKRITDAITLLIDSAKKKRVYQRNSKKWFSFKINFITLTLPHNQLHSDAHAHEHYLAPFLRKWKSKEPNLLYVWKAETQSNGNIHYHLLTNSFIHVSDLRTWWNTVLIREGYKFRTESASTQVKSVIDGDSIVAYVAKYMSKNDEYLDYCPIDRNGECTVSNGVSYYKKRKIDGKNWNCSKALLKYKCEPIELLDNGNGEIEKLKLECKFIHNKYKSTKKYDHVWVQSFKIQWLSECPILYDIYSKAIKELILINANTHSSNLFV